MAPLARLATYTIRRKSRGLWATQQDRYKEGGFSGGIVVLGLAVSLRPPEAPQEEGLPASPRAYGREKERREGRRG